MATEEKERRRLNKKHPDYVEFRRKVDAAVKLYEEECKAIEEKYGRPFTEETGRLFDAECRPAQKTLFSEVNRLMAEYDYLYEDIND